ncbi:MAG TPA: DnaJ domain-containing protein, partial [Ideonella sp.]|nr:DnaJ domain-containing protein [Ideonella sp.]
MPHSTISDPYAELGVTRRASEREIKDAYRRLAARWHPDRNAHPRAAERMARINQAYRQLS